MRACPAALFFVALLGACVPYPGELPDDGRGSSLPPIIEGAYPGLDPGANEQQGLHFKVKAYGPDTARALSEAAERAYARIMTDTGLYSFQPRGQYQIVAYGTSEEFHKKTGQPDWSSAVTIGNAIYVYLSPRLEAVLSHEMTHLIWFEFMGGRLIQAQRWINEGLAVYEEAKASDLRGADLLAPLQGALRAAPIPMDQLQNMVPASERAYEANVWYAQSESMIRFMIERGGRIGFGQFLIALRDGQNYDQAVAASFPGHWRALADFESEWKRSLP